MVADSAVEGGRRALELPRVGGRVGWKQCTGAQWRRGWRQGASWSSWTAAGSCYGTASGGIHGVRRQPSVNCALFSRCRRSSRFLSLVSLCSRQSMKQSIVAHSTPPRPRTLQGRGCGTRRGLLPSSSYTSGWAAPPLKTHHDDLCSTGSCQFKHLALMSGWLYGAPPYPRFLGGLSASRTTGCGCAPQGVALIRSKTTLPPPTSTRRAVTHLGTARRCLHSSSTTLGRGVRRSSYCTNSTATASGSGRAGAPTIVPLPLRRGPSKVPTPTTRRYLGAISYYR